MGEWIALTTKETKQISKPSNPLNPKSDQHLFSPYNNTAESFISDHENRRNDHQQNKLLIVKQVLLINTLLYL